MTRKKLDLIGMRFGKLTVVSETTALGTFPRKFHCKCDCGSDTFPNYSGLVNRGVSACRSCAYTKHGHAARGHLTPTYHSWSSMVARCTNPNHQKWEFYGGRGITVCPEWMDFSKFLEDMGEKPDTGRRMSIERTDNSKGYYKGNCIWANQSIQMLNTRRIYKKKTTT